MSEEGVMACQECGKRRATVHLTAFVDGKPVQTHLCEECYGEKEGMPPLSQSKLFAQIVSAIAPDLRKMGTTQCPRCGITYLEFRQALRLGCPRDYEVFEESLDMLLERIHGADRHVGKIPSGSAQKKTRPLRLEAARRELEEVVQMEDFEKAAQVRDLIKELERYSAGNDEE